MAGLKSSAVRPRLVALQIALQVVVVALTALVTGQAVRAQDAPAAQEHGASSEPRPAAAGTRAASTPSSSSTAEQHKLPADSTTTHTLELPGRKLLFSATAGSIRLFRPTSPIRRISSTAPSAAAVR